MRILEVQTIAHIKLLVVRQAFYNPNPYFLKKAYDPCRVLDGVGDARTYLQ